MTRFLVAIWILLVFWSSTALPDASAATGEPVTILLYHRFDEAKYPTTSISKSAFEQQLDYLRKEGYRFLNVATFRRILDGREPAGPRDVFITVDDGYQSVHDVAWPMLRSRKIPFVVFLSTMPVEKRYRSIMTWPAIEAMADAGVVFANHTHTHPHLGLRNTGESVDAYRVRVRDEIGTAHRLLKDHGIENDLFAYPYGEYNRVVVEELNRAGYRLLFSQNPGVTFTGADRTRIDRMAIVGGNMTLEAFKEKLSRRPLSAVRETPPQVWHGGSLDRIRVRIEKPGLYRAGQVNLFLSEIGRLDAHYDPETGFVDVPGPIPLSRDLNRIILTAREKESGLFGMQSWLLLREETDSRKD